LHMSISDDPRGFRRGQPGNSQYPSADGRGEEPKRQAARPDPRNGARPPSPRQEEQYPAFKDAGDGPAFAERPAQPPQSQRQPSFSAYRPEAYASNGEKRGGRAERPEWPAENHFPGEQPQQPPRAAAENRPAPRPQPQPEPFRPQPAVERPRTSPDPYHSAASDPYDAGRRDFESTWRDDSYPEPTANQFAASSNYYQHHDDPNPAEVQSVHDRFFAADPEPERAPKPAPAAQQAPRYRNDDFAAHDYGEEDRPPLRAAKPAPAPARNPNYDDGGDYRWDNFDQPAAPEAVRPSFPVAKMGAGMAGNDDLDADYFADEDEFEGDEDYVEPKKSGGKKLMAAVLVGAVVTGGGLAYMYKSQVGGNAERGEPPVVAANVGSFKEPPANPGGREFPNGGKLIYERLGEPAGDEPSRAASRDGASGDGTLPGVMTTGASGTLEERIQNALRDAKRQDDTPEPPITTAANTANPDAPRTVRTEIFRPDGSVETSRNPEPARAAPRRQAPAAAEAEAQPSFATAGSSARLAAAPAREAAAPQPRQQQRVAELTPPAQSAPQVSTGGESGMFVQIAARNDQAAAMAAFADLQQKYAGVLGSHSPSVRKVDLGEKGVWYRLLVGPMANKPDADKLCEDLKAAGMKGCFSRKE
jgi:hypothetical protein